MKLVVQKDIATLKSILTKHYQSYDTIYNGMINSDTYLMIVEKFFFRNSSRASLTIVIAKDDFDQVVMETVGSGGGQGWLFKFDWGAKESFEKDIPLLLDRNNIFYTYKWRKKKETSFFYIMLYKTKKL